MEKFGFFGGSFNPVTIAHINLIKDIIKKENLDKVYFVPMGDLYAKKDLAPLSHRNEMLKIAFEKEKKLDILDISNRDKKTYAIDTFQIIDKMFPDAQRFFIMGSDNYAKMASWKRAEDLKRHYHYIILDRENENTKHISSTIVRQKIKKGEDILAFVPKKVAEYINQNNLYK